MSEKPIVKLVKGNIQPLFTPESEDKKQKIVKFLKDTIEYIESMDDREPVSAFCVIGYTDNGEGKPHYDYVDVGITLDDFIYATERLKFTMQFNESVE